MSGKDSGPFNIKFVGSCKNWLESSEEEHFSHNDIANIFIFYVKVKVKMILVVLNLLFHTI